jgi:para-nitrobenzyl esterase
MPFVFDNVRMTHAMQTTGPGAPQELADAVHGEWVQFMTEARLDRPQYSGPESLRWLDTQTREQRNNTTALFARVLGG